MSLLIVTNSRLAVRAAVNTIRLIAATGFQGRTSELTPEEQKAVVADAAAMITEFIRAWNRNETIEHPDWLVYIDREAHEAKD